MTDFDCINEHFGMKDGAIIATLVFAGTVIGQLIALAAFNLGYAVYSIIRRQ